MVRGRSRSSGRASKSRRRDARTTKRRNYSGFRSSIKCPRRRNARGELSDTSRGSLVMSFGKKAVVGWLVCGAMAGAVYSEAPASETKAPVAGAKPATGAGTSAQRAKASLEPLLQQGMDALAAGQYQPAREAFLDAIAIDVRNVKAHHGLALCMVAQKEVAKAQSTLDKALTMTTTPDRALVLNAIACNMATQMHMRAAKLAKDYLTAHPKDQDEPMVNALGTALSAATAAERKNRFFSECTSFYMIANQRPDSPRPG